MSFISQGEKYGTCSANKKKRDLLTQKKGQLIFIHAPAYFHMQIWLNGDLMRTIDLSKQHLLKGQSKKALFYFLSTPLVKKVEIWSTEKLLYPRTLLSPLLRKITESTQSKIYFTALSAQHAKVFLLWNGCAPESAGFIWSLQTQQDHFDRL